MSPLIVIGVAVFVAIDSYVMWRVFFKPRRDAAESPTQPPSGRSG